MRDGGFLSAVQNFNFLAGRSNGVLNPHQLVSMSVLTYIPNLIGYARLLLTLVSLIAAERVAHPREARSTTASFASAAAARPWLCLIYLAATLSAMILDAVDGWAARRFDQTSEFGAQLDVLCDNALRTSCWIVAALVDPRALPLGVVVLCLEWLTLLATQSAPSLEARLVRQRAGSSARGATTTRRGGQSGTWRDDALAAQHPWLVRAYFANGFRNPLGVLGIASLFFAPLHISAGGVLWQRGDDSGSWGAEIVRSPLWLGVGALLLGGRVVSACIEGYFVRKHILALVELENA